MKVRVSVRGRFHGFDLARELAAHGALERLVTSYPAFAAQRAGLSRASVLSLPRHEVAARAVRALPAKLAQALEADVAAAFARAAARTTPDALDVLVAFSGQALEQLEPARARGALTVLERGSAHVETQRDLLIEAGERAGVRVRLPHPRLVARERAEYERADRIAVPSDFAARTFLERGVAAEKLIVNPYGVDLRAFRPAARPPRRTRFVAVGRVSVQKGSHLLVEAFQRSSLEAELVFAGPIEPELASFARRAASSRVRFLGPLPAARLPALYHEASALCLPSIQDGFGLVLLQAMACGLPAIASDHTGAHGRFGEADGVLVVPAGDVDALAAALVRLADDPEATSELGRRASERVSLGYSWADYGSRAMTALRGALAARDRTPTVPPRRSRPTAAELSAELAPPAAPRSTWVPPHRRRSAA